MNNRKICPHKITLTLSLIKPINDVAINLMSEQRKSSKGYWQQYERENTNSQKKRSLLHRFFPSPGFVFNHRASTQYAFSGKRWRLWLKRQHVKKSYYNHNQLHLDGEPLDKEEIRRSKYCTTKYHITFHTTHSNLNTKRLRQTIHTKTNNLVTVRLEKGESETISVVNYVVIVVVNVVVVIVVK